MDRDEELLEKAVARLNAKLMGIVLGTLFGIGLFVATNFLVIKGGDEVGPHLALLGNYFPGYTVTFVGSLIGFGYAFATGFLVGTAIGMVYNKIARV